jgi:uroporphyrinogen-III synthase
VDAVTLSSAEGLQNLIEMLGADATAKLAATALFVPHARVAREAERRGLRAVIAGPRDAQMAAALVAYFGGAR